MSRPSSAPQLPDPATNPHYRDAEAHRGVLEKPHRPVPGVGGAEHEGDVGSVRGVNGVDKVVNGNRDVKPPPSEHRQRQDQVMGSEVKRANLDSKDSIGDSADHVGDDRKSHDAVGEPRSPASRVPIVEHPYSFRIPDSVDAGARPVSALRPPPGVVPDWQKKLHEKRAEEAKRAKERIQVKKLTYPKSDDGDRDRFHDPVKPRSVIDPAGVAITLVDEVIPGSVSLDTPSFVGLSSGKIGAIPNGEYAAMVPPGVPDEPDYGLKVLNPIEEVEPLSTHNDTKVMVVIPTSARRITQKTWKSAHAGTWYLFRGKATMGNYRHEGGSVEDLARACREDDVCEGFSTDGNLVKNIDVVNLKKVNSNGVKLYTKRRILVTSKPVQEKETGYWRLQSHTVVNEAKLKRFNFRSVPTAAKECDAEPACVGFTTDGTMVSVADTGTITLASRGDLYLAKEPWPQDYIVGTVQSLLASWQNCKAPFFEGKYHAIVLNTSPAVEVPLHDAFYQLKEAYGHLPCITFLSYFKRWREVAPPTYNRGASREKKKKRRKGIDQTLDFARAIDIGAKTAPNAHIVMWEDDCWVCNTAWVHFEQAVNGLEQVDPEFGSIKAGNGGSGILIHRKHARPLVSFLKTHRGSEGVDVSMWRYLYTFHLSDYLSKQTLSAHRGLRSSFRTNSWRAGLWKRVECGNALDYYWGEYDTCLALPDTEAHRWNRNWSCGTRNPVYKSRNAVDPFKSPKFKP